MRVAFCCLAVFSFALQAEPQKPIKAYDKLKNLSPRMLDLKLRNKIRALGLTGNPALGRRIPDINESKLAQLGRELFFSKSLSIDTEVSCAHCHHPNFAGADGLSLPVGVGAIESNVIGLGRRHNGNTTQDPEANAGPNVERNSPTTFNSQLYDFALFMDGRLEVVKQQSGFFLPLRDYYQKEVKNGVLTKKPSFVGIRQRLRTPDSLFGGVDIHAGAGLLEAQARFPVVAATEMRGVSHKIMGNHQVRQQIVKRLLGKNSDLKVNRWEALFRNALNQPKLPLDKVITFDNIALALAEYQRSQTFVNNPWKQYLQGKKEVSNQVKLGALLFYTDVKDGGGGCASCHEGDFMTDEGYYNIAVPQFGRGNFIHGQDLGRQAISKSSLDYYAFRVPSLLNVAKTSPYGHTGAFESLEDMVLHHLNPRSSIESFDFSLQSLPQFKGLKVSYPMAKSNTQKALNEYLKVTKAFPKKRAVNPNIDKQGITSIVEFLKSLTDPCIEDSECLKPWLPQGVAPDENRFKAVFLNEIDNESPLPVYNHSKKKLVNNNISLGDVPKYDPVCQYSKVRNKDGKGFTESHQSIGVHLTRTVKKQELLDAISVPGDAFLQGLLFTGGVAVGDLNGDCFDDLIIDSGTNSLVLYINNKDGTYSDRTKNWGLIYDKGFSNATIADLNGDQWPDVFVTNIYREPPEVFFNTGKGSFIKQDRIGIRVGRMTMGSGFGDIDGDGDIDVFLGHWDRPTGIEEEHLWLNNGTGLFLGGARKFGLVGHFGEQDFTFSPNFTDINNDGLTDLISVADFMTTQVFINDGTSKLNNITNKKIINDRNGMGTAIADFDNDGDLDWFVSSIYSKNIKIKNGFTSAKNTENRLKYNGNRFYRNDGISPNGIDFKDITEISGVRDGGWGWGACALDVNNDGWLDIFHTNGSPFNLATIMPDAKNLWYELGFKSFNDMFTYNSWVIFDTIIKKNVSDDKLNDLKHLYHFIRNMGGETFNEKFANEPSRLFINNKDGTFTEQADMFGISDTKQGRGVACYDYDEDGDIDILVVNHAGNVSFYRNDLGAKGANYLRIRLLNDFSANTLMGSKIMVQSPLGQQIREVRVENNYLSQNSIATHFGLGDDNKVNVTITWPDNTVVEYKDVEVNQQLQIKKVR